MSLKFADLTEAQRSAICNGCGRKGGLVPVPDFVFTASCDRHDFGYWRGAPWGFKRLRRLECDQRFYEALLNDVAEQPKEKQAFYYRWAYRFFLAVRFVGWCAFNWGRERTEKDLPPG